MLYFLKLLFLLIHIDQETILNWFGITSSENTRITPGQYETNMVNTFADVNTGLSTKVSIETARLIIEGLWNKFQSGLTLGDVESVVFFILFVRFVILTIKYNLKTSFYITCITFASGYLWYRHLIDLMLVYRNILLSLPFFHKLGMSTVELQVVGHQNVKTDMMLGENIHWYNIGKLLYYTFTKGIVDVDPVTGFKSYIDPISMIVANLDEPMKSNITPYYYKVYNKWIPKIFSACSKFWTQLSGILAYAVVTRIGKKYCPYLVRWHWTLLLVISFPEQMVIALTKRIIYFQSTVLVPQLVQVYELSQLTPELAEEYAEYGFVNQIEIVDENILVQVNFLNAFLACIVLIHMSFVLLCLLHAVCGQYFYIPFFVENAELHTGPRPKNSVYSGGYTSWQDDKEKNRQGKWPKLWYGWLGHQTNWKPIQATFYYLKRAIRIRFKKWRKN